MKVEEAIAMREELEKVIGQMLRNFEKETKTRVTAVAFGPVSISKYADGSSPFIADGVCCLTVTL